MCPLIQCVRAVFLFISSRAALLAARHVHRISGILPMHDPAHQKNPNTKLVLFVVLKPPGYTPFSSRKSVKQFYFDAFGLLAPYLERACFLLATPAVSSVPLMIWYLVPGKSFTLPPRIKTTLCSCKLCPSPGM